MKGKCEWGKVDEELALEDRRVSRIEKELNRQKKRRLRQVELFVKYSLNLSNFSLCEIIFYNNDCIMKITLLENAI